MTSRLDRRDFLRLGLSAAAASALPGCGGGGFDERYTEEDAARLVDQKRAEKARSGSGPFGPQVYRGYRGLAELPWFELDGNGNLRCVAEDVPPAIDVHAHLGMALFLAPELDLQARTARVRHMLDCDAQEPGCPLDLDVYVNANFSPSDLNALRRMAVAQFTIGSSAAATHTIPNLLAEMDAARVEQALILPIAFGLPFGDDLTEAWTAAIRRAAVGHRLLTGASVFPRDPQAVDKLRRYAADGARAVKLHPNAQRYYPDAPEAMAIYEECGRLGLPVCLHSGRAGIEPERVHRYMLPRHYEPMLRRFPEVDFVFLHAGSRDLADALPLAERYPNVWLGIHGQGVSALAEILGRVGPDRLLFGTDWPFYPLAVSLAKVLMVSEGRPQVREAILRGNALRLLGETGGLGMSERLWWQDGVVYQIYPRSFMDSNGDGVGDLEGIRRRLDHLAWLGIDAVWLSPIFPSPMADFGYDVADYCDVEPLFGDLAGFDRLQEEVRQRGIRLILDWVPNHTSDRHAWFQESRSGRSSPKRDWYVWRDPKPHGSPPNNWQSVFGGGAWEWDEASGQSYLHSFLKEQPDLNWRNPEVVAAMHDVLRFWLDRGVGGFRIDVIHKIAKDPGLRDNPPHESGHPGYLGQRHIHDENHPDTPEYLRGIRRVLNEYDARMTVGEVFIVDPEVAASYYVNGEGLHLAFNFAFLRAPWSAGTFRQETEAFEAALPQGCWPDLVLSNHDVPRHASRYDDPVLGEARARVAAAMLLTLRGTPFLYYGEEIGMRNVAIPDDQILDPVGIHIHPAVGRDGERTPMQWSPASGAGFSEGTPWLPIGPDADERNVEAQRQDPASLLCLYRDLLALRRATPALHRGAYRSLDAPEDVFAYERRADASRVLVALNFSGGERRVKLGAGAVRGGLRTVHGTPLPERADEIHLAPSEAAVLVVDALG